MMLNLRGREAESSEERERDSVRVVEERRPMRVMGREREVRTAAVVLSIELRAVMYWRRGEESDEEVERWEA